MSAWATAYLGPGPWGSLAPALPSVPSQILEGVVTLLIALALGLALVLGAFRIPRRTGAPGRHRDVGRRAEPSIALTWRDPAVVGPLGMGSVIALGVAIGCTIAAVVMTIRPRRRPRRYPTTGATTTTVATEPRWPDPVARAGS